MKEIKRAITYSALNAPGEFKRGSHGHKSSKQ